MPHLPAQRRNVIDMVQDQLVLVQGVVGYLGGAASGLLSTSAG